jgi:hypothetical protein
MASNEGRANGNAERSKRQQKTIPENKKRRDSKREIERSTLKASERIQNRIKKGEKLLLERILQCSSLDKPVVTRIQINDRKK